MTLRLQLLATNCETPLANGSPEALSVCLMMLIIDLLPEFRQWIGRAQKLHNYRKQ